MLRYSKARTVLLLVLSLLLPRLSRAAEGIAFSQETLDNGLRVIYAPLHQAPVVHVRVLYHVGSRDERPSRQGFAHMFEHMMFRGSEHVKPEEHMKLINMVGGISNAFTSFDQTVYWQTLPANQMELALWLEADRMASFKVSDDIFGIERNVVAEEYRRGINQPYGTFFKDYLKLAFKVHPYRWEVIGSMEQLKAARADELQSFFNKYYVPNNAVLVIAGDFDPVAAKAMAHKYFGWIPAGAKVVRDIPQEPAQTQQRREVETKAVPLARIALSYHTPPWASSDHYALNLLGDILEGGQSSRLDRALVNSANPLCINVGGGDLRLEDGGLFMINAMVLQGRDPDEVEKVLFSTVKDVIEKGVSDQELEKAKTRQRVALVRGRETADQIAGQLGSEALFANDPGRVNSELEKTNAVTAADVQEVARKYLRPENSILLRVVSGREPPTTAPAEPTTVGPAVEKAAPRDVKFPADYPLKPPIADAKISVNFAKGVEANQNGVTVIVMEDHRLPLATWSLTMRAGALTDPAGKEGLTSLMADMMRRGAAGLGFNQLNEDLESRGISISVNDGNDTLGLVGSCLKEQLAHGIQRSRDILLSPTLPEDEFAKLRQQTLSRLIFAQAQPNTAAQWELSKALFGNTPLGRHITPASVGAISLDDIRECYKRLVKPTDAVFIIAGDVSVQEGQALAKRLLEGWSAGPLPGVDLRLPPESGKLHIIVVDRPEGKQAMIRMAGRIYDVHSDEKYAGELASIILSDGINSRLGRYVRAEKGLVYSVGGRFGPQRQGSEFYGLAETKLTTTAECVEAMFKVFADMGKDGVSEQELHEAKLRAVGLMVLRTQTIQQQAGSRLEAILDHFPPDYWDRYPERISAVAARHIAAVAAKYLAPDRLTVVVVAPAAQVKDQLQKLGSVEVVPMPGKAAP